MLHRVHRTDMCILWLLFCIYASHTIQPCVTKHPPAGIIWKHTVASCNTRTVTHSNHQKDTHAATLHPPKKKNINQTKSTPNKLTAPFIPFVFVPFLVPGSLSLSLSTRRRWLFSGRLDWWTRNHRHLNDWRPTKLLPSTTGSAGGRMDGLGKMVGLVLGRWVGLGWSLSGWLLMVGWVGGVAFKQSKSAPMMFFAKIFLGISAMTFLMTNSKKNNLTTPKACRICFLTSMVAAKKSE